MSSHFPYPRKRLRELLLFFQFFALFMCSKFGLHLVKCEFKILYADWITKCHLILKILFEKLSVTNGNLISVGSLAKCHQQPQKGETEARSKNLIRVSHLNCRSISTVICWFNVVNISSQLCWKWRQDSNQVLCYGIQAYRSKKKSNSIGITVPGVFLC